MRFDGVLMDSLDLDLFNDEEQQKIIDGMLITDRAKIKCLPDYLSIKEICDLRFPIPDYYSKPDDKSLHKEWRNEKKLLAEIDTGFKDLLINACINSEMTYKGNIKGWTYYSNSNNPHPLAREGSRAPWIPSPDDNYKYDTRYALGKSEPVIITCTSTDCTLHKREFKRYIKSIGKWTAVNKGLLANWWVGDIKEVIKMDTRDARIKMILEVINRLSIDPMGIPEGNKKKIKDECLKIKVDDLNFTVEGLKSTRKDPEKKMLFNDSGFDRAWSEATTPKRKGEKAVLSMADKKSYTGKHL